MWYKVKELVESGLIISQIHVETGLDRVFIQEENLGDILLRRWIDSNDVVIGKYMVVPRTMLIVYFLRKDNYIT